MDKNSKYLKRFEECIPVKGYLRSAIYDLPRKKFDLIPNYLYDFLINHNNKTVEEILNAYPKKEHELIKSYIAYLLEKDYVFYCDENEMELFPSLSMDWDYPAIISNAIIEIENTLETKKIIAQLERVGCIHAQIVFKNNSDVYKMNEVLQAFEDSRFLSVEFAANYNENLQKEALRNLFDKYSRLRVISFFAAPNTEIYLKHQLFDVVYLFEQSLTYDTFVDYDYFNVNIGIFTEAQNYHTYFNRKIFIDADGNIKNYPTQLQVFGNIKDEVIYNVVKSLEFQRLWMVKKDSIDVCRDCEFRYMCIDNKVPNQRVDGSWYHKKECNYNPYVAKWQNEEGYLPLNAIGVEAQENIFRIDFEKVNLINEETYAEE